MFIIVLFIVAKMWKEPKVPSIDEYVVKENVVYIHTKEEPSTLKRSEVLIHATTWIKLDNIMPSERSQIQKATYTV